MTSPLFDYEALSPSEFQALVSALVVREYPNVQCMPLHGRDGGRDVIVQESDSDNKMRDRIVFQCKAKERTPTGVPTAEDLLIWAKRAVTRELKGISKLIERGMKQYVFVTNLPASGDMETGLRDKFKNFLDAKIPVPATVWWREDIDSRLRANPRIAAVHRLIKDATVLHNLCDEVALDDAGTSIAVDAIRSYCQHQYEEDYRMRFRQVDLDNPHVIDLFVDVPLMPNFPIERERADPVWRRELYQLMELEREQSLSAGEGDDVVIQGVGPHHRTTPGAADFLLNSSRALLKAAYIEGAPGQGKSTISQYVCQVHRARILGVLDDLAKLPRRQANSEVRIPFRVELRRYVTWLSKANGSEDRGILRYIRSTIARVSELDFNSNHLHKVLTGGGCTIFLDGLDEVADLIERESVSKDIVQLLGNLSAWRSDVQVVVTSRPSTLVGGSQVLTSAKMSKYVLADLMPETIQSYAEKWLQVKKIVGEEAEELRAAFQSALNAPHVSDLARNPMQMAILLYLIYTRGGSIPDKRTALYANYLDAFLTREADKSNAVARHRDILLELHGFLAWIMHSRAESSDGLDAAGDLSRADLEELLRNYLIREQRSPELVDDVFAGVQRFFVLVERVEGRFEFEVQPLREYFAAFFLYETSPSSPATMDQGGATIIERLEKLVRSRYWLSVVRFYAGFYTKGELPSLSRALGDLLRDPDLSLTIHSREIVARVLLDYSVSPSQRDSNTLANDLSSGVGLRVLARGLRRQLRSPEASVEFPDDSGRAEIVKNARRSTREMSARQLRDEAAVVLRANDTRVSEWWTDTCKTEARDSGQVSHELLRIGFLSGALHKAPSSSLAQIYQSVEFSRVDSWGLLAASGRGDIMTPWPAAWEGIRSALANGSSKQKALPSDLRWLSHVRYQISQQRLVDIAMSRYYRLGDRASAVMREDCPEVAIGRLMHVLDLRPDEGELSWWQNSHSAVREMLGESWASWRVALLAGFCGVGMRARSNSAIGKAAAYLEALRSGVAPSMLPADIARKPGGNLAAIVMALSWSEGATLPAMLSDISQYWADLSEFQIADIRSAVDQLYYWTRYRKGTRVVKLGDIELDRLSPSLLLTIMPRMRVAEQDKLLNEIALREPSENEMHFVNGEVVNLLARRAIRKPSASALTEIRRRYETAHTPIAYMSARLTGTNKAPASLLASRKRTRSKS